MNTLKYEAIKDLIFSHMESALRALPQEVDTKLLNALTYNFTGEVTHELQKAVFPCMPQDVQEKLRNQDQSLVLRAFFEATVNLHMSMQQ